MTTAVATAAAVQWTPELELHEPHIDATHREFVDLLNGLHDIANAEAATQGQLLEALDALIVHSEAHFAMEERWMAAVGFAPENCHSRQHALVLDVLREVRKHVEAGKDLDPVRRLPTELGQWFGFHAEAMDAALVYTMQQAGYDPETGHCAQPPQGEPQSGCGSSSCS
jgi:hemerythrin